MARAPTRAPFSQGRSQTLEGRLAMSITTRVTDYLTHGSTRPMHRLLMNDIEPVKELRAGRLSQPDKQVQWPRAK